MEKHWKQKINQIVNGSDTIYGRAFDIGLVLSILMSSMLLILDSVSSIHTLYGDVIYIVENSFLVVFSIEFVLRLIVAPKKQKYLLSFYGLVDFMSTVPIYFSFFIPGGRSFVIIRTLRLLRLFSIFKMGRYVRESRQLKQALLDSRSKILVFLTAILFVIVIAGSVMYLIEGPQNGFSSIPEAMYWAVVTVSTVGYGDISPQTPLGKVIASVLMLVGYAIIAVPTGIITSNIAIQTKEGQRVVQQVCSHCQTERLSTEALYCHKCGQKF